jgi:hypothetical protein
VTAVPFDRSVLKVNQAIVVTTLVAGWAVGLRFAVAAAVIPAMALMMLAAALVPAASLPRALYVRILRPLGVIRPRVVVEDPAPHRFAQFLGGSMLAGASVLAACNAMLVAWTLAWVVVALAGLNLTTDICLGCILHAQLVRAGVIRRRAPA